MNRWLQQAAWPRIAFLVGLALLAAFAALSCPIDAGGAP